MAQPKSGAAPDDTAILADAAPFVARGVADRNCRLGGARSFQGGVMEFWTEPQMASIHKMLNPRSIAIVGATPRMQYGGRVLGAALKAPDRVRGYARKPRYEGIMGGEV